jgi:ABC-type phosphate/phosphonate transport system substrate-binding protein
MPRAVLQRLQVAAATDELSHGLFAVEEGFAGKHSPAAVTVKEGDVPAVSVGGKATAQLRRRGPSTSHQK